jgi:HAD superfamily hydrolase (TIGR01509 family)
MLTIPNSIDAVIFDMDGLLIDTERIYVIAIMAAGRAIGVEITEAFCLSMIGIPQKECDVMIQDHFGPAFPMPDYSRQYSAQVKALLQAGVPLKSGAFELVDHVSSSGIPKAIATSSNRASALHHLRTAGLLDHFRVLLTRDDVQHGKPHPELYLKASQALGVKPSRCLAIEDSHNGIRSAYAAGAMPIMVPDLLIPTDEIRAMCIGVVGDLHQVRQIIVEHAARTTA